MSTFATRRADLTTAMAAGSVKVSPAPGSIAPPVVLIFGDGIPDLRGIGRGQVPARFRLILLAGKPDAAASAKALDALLLAVLSVLRALAGWTIVEVRGVRTRSDAGSLYLSSDVIVESMIEIP
jgi:hypothetical protein